MLNRSGLTGTRGLATMAAALFALLALGPIGAATANPIGSGETSLKLDAGLYDRLRDEGVRVLGLKPATVKGRLAKLPIAEGQADWAAKGSMRHKGGIKLKAGTKVVTLKKVFLNTAKLALTATVGKQTLKIASTQPHTVAWDGFDLDVAIRELPLTGRAARLLNRKLGLDGVFASRHSLGRIANVTRLESITVFGGTIAVSFDEGFAGKLKSLGVTSSPFGSTKVIGSQPQTYELEIRHGQVTPDLSEGALVSEGGVRLSQEGPESPVMTLAPMSVALDSKRLSGGSSPLGAIEIQPGTMQVDPKTGAIALPATRMTLEPYSSAPLNEAFAKGKDPVFSAGETLGTVAFTLNTR